MGNAYVAKAAAAADVCASGPSGWDPFWLFPGPPWAPGWPITIPTGYSLNLTLGAVSVGAAANLVASVLFSGLDDANLQCHALQITALINGSTLQVSNDGVTYANSLNSSVKNYSGTSYGFNKNLYLNLTNANIGQSGSITVTNISTNPTFSATVNFTVAGILTLIAASTDGTHQVQGSADFINWVPETAAAVLSFQSVCYADTLGLYVAVGLNSVQTSPDGLTWTNQPSIPTGTWRCVCWSHALGKLIAVNDDNATTAGNCVMVSTNGINWSAINTPGRPWKSVVYAPSLNQFVAVANTGSSRAAMLSTDGGVTWNLTTPISPMATVKSVSWSTTLSIYVAVGATAAYSSTDGQTWTSRTIPAGTYNSVTNSGGTFVAVGLAGAVATSTNGTSWTSRTAAEANDWFSVCWSTTLGSFVAVSQNGTHRIMTSTDGGISNAWAAQTAAEQNSLSCVCAKS